MRNAEYENTFGLQLNSGVNHGYRLRWISRFLRRELTRYPAWRGRGEGFNHSATRTVLYIRSVPWYWVINPSCERKLSSTLPLPLQKTPFDGVDFEEGPLTVPSLWKSHQLVTIARTTCKETCPSLYKGRKLGCRMHARGCGVDWTSSMRSPPRGTINNGDRSVGIISNLCYVLMCPFPLVRNFHLSVIPLRQDETCLRANGGRTVTGVACSCRKVSSIFARMRFVPRQISLYKVANRTIFFSGTTIYVTFYLYSIICWSFFILLNSIVICVSMFSTLSSNSTE